MKLTDYIEQMRGQLHDNHSEAMRLLDNVGARIFENDCDVMRRLEEIQEGQARRATDIIQLAQMIAARVGHVPQDAHAKHYIGGSPRAGLPAAGRPSMPSETTAAGVFDTLYN